MLKYAWRTGVRSTITKESRNNSKSKQQGRTSSIPSCLLDTKWFLLFSTLVCHVLLWHSRGFGINHNSNISCIHEQLKAMRLVRILMFSCQVSSQATAMKAMIHLWNFHNLLWVKSVWLIDINSCHRFLVLWQGIKPVTYDPHSASSSLLHSCQPLLFWRNGSYFGPSSFWLNLRFLCFPNSELYKIDCISNFTLRDS